MYGILTGAKSRNNSMREQLGNKWLDRKVENEDTIAPGHRENTNRKIDVIRFYKIGLTEQKMHRKI